MKYIVVYIGAIAIQIAVEKDIRGYTEGVLEAFLPESEGWKSNQINRWTKQNNRRMEAICEMLNNKQL